MKIDVRDLLYSVPAIKAPGTRVGLPDGPTPVRVTHPDRFATKLDAAMSAFWELRPGTQTLVSADVNACRKEVWVRVLQNGPSRRDRNGQVEASLSRSLEALRAAAEANRGEVHYWGGNNYLDVSLPYPNPGRGDFLDVKHLPWNEQYRILLERESWSSLRDRVFRFSALAVRVADRCLACGKSSVFVPSAGLCVDPWLFATRGLTVTASDSANTALAAVSEPGSHPNLYSSTAYERWDIATCASFAMIPHPDHFDGMPPLEVDHVREALRQRISFLYADWANLPILDCSVDLVFATNALPRGSDAERVAVFDEWVRVLRPGGVVYIAQHHAGADWGLESLLLERGLCASDFLRGEGPPKGWRGAFQIRYSSG